MTNIITFNNINFAIDKHTTRIDPEVKAYETLTTVTGVNLRNQVVFQLKVKERFFDRDVYKENILTIHQLIQDDTKILLPLFDKIENKIDPYDEKQQIMKNWVGYLEDRLELEQHAYHADVI